MRWFLTFLILLSLISCAKPEVTRICFIGDSIVARWDLMASFPNHYTENLARSGAGISYLQEKKGCAKGKILVVLIGTNDCDSFYDDYAENYIDTIKQLDAELTYVISILPRSYPGDAYNINTTICGMNQQIRFLVEQNGWIYLNAYPLMINEEGICINYFSDGLHLSQHGYEVLNKLVRDAI